MNDLFRTTIFIASMFVTNIITKQKHVLKYYIIMGLCFLLINIFISGLYANEYRDSQVDMVEVKSLILEKKIYLYDLPPIRDNHLREAQEYYKMAEERCWYIPSIDDSVKSRICFSTALILIGPGDQPSKIILGILNILGSYGLECYKEWEMIEFWLNESKYHYEMYEFYRDIIERGTDDW